MNNSAVTPIADPTDTLLVWAASTEAHLATQLAGVDIFADIDFTGDELERLTRFYGTFLGRQISAGAEETALLESCPALTATTLLARAARLSDIHDLNHEYWAGLGIEPTEYRCELLSDYRHILIAAGLSAMDEAAAGPDGHNGRLFAHIGVASDWIPELIEMIDSRRLSGQREESISDEAVAIVALLARGDRQAGPLAQTMPDLARRLLEPMVELVYFVAHNPEWWHHQLDRAFVETEGLPGLILEDVVEELRERPAGIEQRRHQVGVASREDRPRLHLDVRRQRIVLRLPEVPIPVEDHDNDDFIVRWRVDFDGNPAAYRTARGAIHAHAVTEVLDIPVRQPLRELLVRDITHGHSWSLPVVSQEDPLLMFSMRGKDLSSLASLHYEEMYVVCPQESVLIDPVRDKNIVVVEEIPLKNWDGWVIRHVDFSEVLSINIARGKQTPLQSSRCVDPRQRVRFMESSALPSLETAGGLKIHNQSLQAVFPPTISGKNEEWFLSVSSYAGPGHQGEEVSEEEPLEVPAEGGVFDVFDPDVYDSPWVGEYLVRLRGPRNESFRHEYAIVEGMNVGLVIDAPASQTRLPLTQGLSPVTVALRSGDKPFEVEGSPHVGPEQRYSTVIISTDAGDVLPIMIDPPRLNYQLPLKGEDPLWRTEAHSAAAVQVDCDSKFRVRPGADIEEPRMVIRDKHGSPVRTLKLQTVDGVTWFTPLTSLESPLATLGSGSCEFEFVDQRASKRVSVRLLNFRPEPEWFLQWSGQEGSEEEQEEKDFYSEGLIEVHPYEPGMRAWIWPVTAPWLPAHTVEIKPAPAAPGKEPEHGVITLPSELQLAGDLKVQFFSTDRFNSLRAPIIPGRALSLEQPGVMNEDDGGPWSQLSAFLAGEREDAPTDPSILATLWDVQAGWLSQRTYLSTKERNQAQRDKTRIALRSALIQNPHASVHAMSGSLVSAADRPAQFILGGLVYSSFSRDPEDKIEERLGTPWISALEELGQWSQIDEDSDTLREQRRDISKALKDIAGEELLTTLTTGHDSTLESACIDDTTVQIAHMSGAQQKAVLDMFFAGTGVVPGALSDSNSRLIAVFEAFQHREEVSKILEDPEFMRIVVATLRRIKGANRHIYMSARIRLDKLDGVDTDNPKNRWALAPVASMILALAARMYAHGRLKSLGALKDAIAGWAALARILPDLVTGDIVAADAMVLGVYGPDIPEASGAEEKEEHTD